MSALDFTYLNTWYVIQIIANTYRNENAGKTVRLINTVKVTFPFEQLIFWTFLNLKVPTRNGVLGQDLK